jgi:hypothetical protein
MVRSRYLEKVCTFDSQNDFDNSVVISNVGMNCTEGDLCPIDYDSCYLDFCSNYYAYCPEGDPGPDFCTGKKILIIKMFSVQQKLLLQAASLMTHCD